MGVGNGGFSGDGGPATSASLNLPVGLALDTGGNLFIVDRFNHRILRVDAASGIITTVAGDGTPAFGGDGGPNLDGSLLSVSASSADDACPSDPNCDSGLGYVFFVPPPAACPSGGPGPFDISYFYSFIHENPLTTTLAPGETFTFHNAPGGCRALPIPPRAKPTVPGKFEPTTTIL